MGLLRVRAISHPKQEVTSVPPGSATISGPRPPTNASSPPGASAVLMRISEPIAADPIEPNTPADPSGDLARGRGDLPSSAR